MTIEWQYIDETTWNEYVIGAGIVNPRTSFVVRMTDENGKIKTRFVSICGDIYTPAIQLDIIDNSEERKYTPSIIGIPEEEIDNIIWSITHDDIEYVYTSGEVDATGVDVVCVSATVELLCGCDDIVIQERCYTFTGEQVNCPSDLGIDLVIEDGCWKPIRTGTITCCVALDLILYRLSENDDWSILRDPYETICGNIVYFKRVVTFKDGLCETYVIEKNTDES